MAGIVVLDYSIKPCTAEPFGRGHRVDVYVRWEDGRSVHYAAAWFVDRKDAEDWVKSRDTTTGGAGGG